MSGIVLDAGPVVLLGIVGPTAVGKSKVAVEVSGLLDGELISCDSMQVYRGMDVGTAKLRPEETMAANGKVVAQHLVDIVSPRENFNAARFQQVARRAIHDVHRRGKLPILVGGTGLYLRAVIDNYTFGRARGDRQLRTKLLSTAKRLGKGYLHRRLAEMDPGAALCIHPHDLRRVIRALEVCIRDGGEQPDHAPGSEEQRRYRPVLVGLTLPRPVLYERVNRRVDEMFDAGLVEEVRSLLGAGCPSQGTAMHALGYRQVLAYLRGECTLEEARGLIKRDTRRYAKRQLTWFRHDPRVIWLEVNPDKGPVEVGRQVETIFQETIDLMDKQGI